MAGTPRSEWEFTDVWLLAAIGSYRRPCSLSEVIAAADRIRHAILLEGELEGALGKLTGAGLVRVFEGWTLELTDDGQSVWTGNEQDLADHLKALLEQLSALEPGTTVVKVPRGLFDQAVEEYRSR
jgi:hypothetical protein